MKRIVLAGGSGFLGGVLSASFLERGFHVIVLTRAPSRDATAPREVLWNAETLGPWTEELEGADAVINLTGRSVDCRYTARNRHEMMHSRVASTRVIGAAISKCRVPPRVWLNASTATIYKHTDGPAWDEDGETGEAPEAHDAFSIEIARAWEKAFFSASTSSTRKIALRSAMVLGCGSNSVFPVLRRLVRAGLGGKHASGTQFVSWIHQEDFCRAVDWLLQHDQAAGIYNLCAPNPLTNSEMMRLFRRTFGMPFGLPASRWMLELGAFFLRTESELILKSRRVFPKRLLDEGFEFQFSTFQAAILDLKNRC